MGASSCDLCAHYVYDDEDDFSECMVNMDEDDYARFITSSYEVVRISSWMMNIK